MVVCTCPAEDRSLAVMNSRQHLTRSVMGTENEEVCTGNTNGCLPLDDEAAAGTMAGTHTAFWRPAEGSQRFFFFLLLGFS